MEDMGGGQRRVCGCRLAVCGLHLVAGSLQANRSNEHQEVHISPIGPIGPIRRYPLSADSLPTKEEPAANHPNRQLQTLLRFRPVHQRQNMLLFLVVAERVKISNFFDPTHAVQRIKKVGVLRRELGGFHVTSSQISVLISVTGPGLEQMKPEPAPVCSRHLLAAAEKGHIEQQDQIGIDQTLQLQISGKIFAVDTTQAGFELKGGMQGVIDLLDEHDKRPNIRIRKAASRIVLFQLLDQPAGIVDPYVQPIISGPEECTRQIAQLSRGCACQTRQMGAPGTINQAVFQIDPDTGVSALEQTLEFAEKRGVHIKLGLAIAMVSQINEFVGQLIKSQTTVSETVRQRFKNGTKLKLLGHAMGSSGMKTGLTQFFVE
jgi:hypothetical protein